MTGTLNENDWDFVEHQPPVKWRCEECGWCSTTRPHTPHYKAYQCPKCKSESFMQVGWNSAEHE